MKPGNHFAVGYRQFDLDCPVVCGQGIINEPEKLRTAFAGQRRNHYPVAACGNLLFQMAAHIIVKQINFIKQLNVAVLLFNVFQSQAAEHL